MFTEAGSTVMLTVEAVVVCWPEGDLRARFLCSVSDFNSRGKSR